MKDYELGKLAEELIQSRYADKLKEKDEKIKSLEIENEKMKDYKTYVRVVHGFPNMGDVHIIYTSIDEITTELENTKESTRIDKEVIKTLKQLHNAKAEKFNILPWYKKISYKFN